jgi:hypothetical protein
MFQGLILNHRIIAANLQVDEFYLHQPDTAASLEATLEACHHLVTKGLIGALGMSNYHAIEVNRGGGLFFFVDKSSFRCCCLCSFLRHLLFFICCASISKSAFREQV